MGKLAALHDFCRDMVIKRGHVGQADLNRFFTAGYTKEQLLEVILGIAEKTISNYTSVALGIPVDDAFEAFAWSPETDLKAA